MLRENTVVVWRKSSLYKDNISRRIGLSVSRKRTEDITEWTWLKTNEVVKIIEDGHRWQNFKITPRLLEVEVCIIRESHGSHGNRMGMGIARLVSRELEWELGLMGMGWNENSTFSHLPPTDS